VVSSDVLVSRHCPGVLKLAKADLIFDSHDLTGSNGFDLRKASGNVR
jgi:hypothetical protein